MPKPLHLALFVAASGARSARRSRRPVVHALMAPLAAIARARGHAERYATGVAA